MSDESNTVSEEEKRRKIREFAEKLTRQLMAEGKILEGGWAAFQLLMMHPKAGSAQINDMKIAYFAGAEHLWSSLMAGLDRDDQEPTAADERKMDLISKELDNFRNTMADLALAKMK